MSKTKTFLAITGISAAVCGLSFGLLGVAPTAGVLAAQGQVKVPDPTQVVMIVNRDSNDIAFMDIKTKKIVGRTFLGNNVNPHMVMMSPDGRYVVTGGTRANKAFIIDARTLELVKVIPVDIAPEHLSFSPDSRWYYQGNPDGDSISVIDMQSLTKIKTIPGFAEPLNVTFTPDGSKAYVGNYGAHWVGVIDVRRHELAKKIQIAAPPGTAKLDPDRFLGELHGINIATPTPDGRFLYAADGALGMVGVIDTREDKVIKTIQVGKDPLRAYMSHDGKYAIVPNNGDETISIIDTKSNKVAATLEAGPDMTGVNFAAGKAFVISSTSGFVYVYNMSSLRPAGRIKLGTNIQLETATTDTADQKLYLAQSTTNEVVIIDARTEAIERVGNVGLYPWGRTSWTARTTTATDVNRYRTPILVGVRTADFVRISKSIFGLLLLTFLVTPSLYSQGIRERIRETAKGASRISEAQAKDVTLTVSDVEQRPIQQIVRAGGTIDKTHRMVTATITTSEGGLVQAGQRARSFPPESKASMYQARVTRVTLSAGKTVVEATLSGEGVEGRVNYVLEITVDRGTYLSIPNEAIIEEGDHRIVYVEKEDGKYEPRKIDTGIQGELYTQVLGGIESGNKVVTFGSFFVDANYKLKGGG